MGTGDQLNGVYTPLKLCFGLVPIVAGADKFLNLLTEWEKYLPSIVSENSPVSPAVFMMVVGVIEIIAGIVVLSKFTRLGAYVVAIWLVLISVNVLLAGFYDIAVRDLVMALGAYSLASLAGMKGQGLIPSKNEGATSAG